MLDKIKLFFIKAKGATTIEYALIAALIAVALITTLTEVKDAIEQAFTYIKTTLTESIE